MYPHFSKASFLYGGSVVDCMSMDRRVEVRASPASLQCVLEQDTLILATGLTQEDPSRHNLKLSTGM